MAPRATMDAFNIGYAGGGGQNSAMKMAIEQIVNRGDKLGLIDRNTMGQVGTSLANTAFKNQLDQNKSGQIFLASPSGVKAGSAPIQGLENKVVNVTPSITGAVAEQMFDPANFHYYDPNSTPTNQGGVGALSETQVQNILNWRKQFNIEANTDLTPEQQQQFNAILQQG